ncbi:MAG: methyl-accepting chemotaxis protein [Nitrospirae bacterium]|jgi:methyl-accepting chemotaxis protein|nr:methyl-accepting chemotaxis protein [Nitrospirota bacterium]MCL5063124.1 methyl-accepting chemotaxis protein [Nitrospirota bacterium]MDA8339119.1 methyl-accepting chemotaxis protein [Nitrospiraceae bacterium]
MAFRLFARKEQQVVAQDNLLPIVQKISIGLIKSTLLGSTITNTMDLIDSNFSRIKDETTSVATAIEEIDATIRDMSGNVSSINTQVQDMVRHNDTLDVELGKRVEDISRQQEKVTEVVNNIQNLGAATENIGNIVVSISDIADQTNLLALNAAIEAARVGDKGRGFAVVADEVRKLAQKTEKLTKGIADILEDLKEKVTTAVGEVDKISEIITAFEQDIKSIRSTFENTKVLSDNVGDSVNNLSSAIEEQSQVLTDVTKRVSLVVSTLEEAHKVFSTVAKVNVEINKMVKF